MTEEEFARSLCVEMGGVWDFLRPAAQERYRRLARAALAVIRHERRNEAPAIRATPRIK